MVDVRIWGVDFQRAGRDWVSARVAYRDEEKRSSRRDSAVFLLLLSALPLVIALAIGLVIRFYEYRYLSFCVAPYYVLIARGMTSFRIRAAAPLLACAALFYSGFALRANYLVPHKENFRDSTTYLAAHSQPGDCYVVVPSGEITTFTWRGMFMRAACLR